VHLLAVVEVHTAHDANLVVTNGDKFSPEKGMIVGINLFYYILKGREKKLWKV